MSKARILRLGLVAGEDFVPVDLALPAVHLLHRAIDGVARGTPDVGPRSVSFDERNDRIVRDDDALVLVADAGAGGRMRDAFSHGAHCSGRVAKSQGLKVSKRGLNPASPLRL